MTTIEAYKVAQENPEFAAEAQAQMQALLARSATDADFRARLLAEPRAALAEFSGNTVPETLNIVFVENGADATIVLPDPIDPAAELSEAELEAVAGGSDLITGIVVGIIASAVLVGGGVAIGRAIN